MKDIYYIKNGMFTRFIPNTPYGESVWRQIYRQTDNTAAYPTAHLESALRQIRAIGCTVGKAPKVNTDMNAVYAELEALGA